MSTEVSKQTQIMRASKQLAMLALLLSKGLITERDYDIIKSTIYRDYPVIKAGFIDK
ncbi:conjugal transfer protein [Herbinix hemicellulosilytica]|uniref:conjugal transfer protein n=1 Tax=Herbinix hemicellulosilytica TaxID=1564487 RepID=UPI000CD25CA0|nr:conjugal transfer protein [Herbinix hemicellulosilytica]